MKNARLSNGWKTVLFVVVLLFLCLPYIQRKFMLLEEKPLGGYSEPVPRPGLSVSSYLNEEFQPKYELYISQQYGFRTTLVRLRNQLDYSLFDQSNTNEVIVGKNGCLYEESYIWAYYGDDYGTDLQIDIQLSKLRMVRDTLAKQNVKLLFVIAPDKASYFPEYIPDRYVKGHKPPPYRTNYKRWLKGMYQRSIPVLDFRHWFIELKKTTKYPLYAMGGIHWSKYGAYIAADSMLRYMENFTGKQLPRFRLDSLVVQKENEPEDYDIAESMNLLFRLPTRPMAYPHFHRDSFPGSIQPRVLVAGDSYFFLFHNYKLSEQYFNDGHFWYYGKEVIHGGPQGGKLVENIDIAKTIKEHEVLVIFTTNRNLMGFTSEFINRLYSTYYPD